MAEIGNDLVQVQQEAGEKKSPAFPHLWQAQNVGWAKEDVLREHVRSAIARELTPFHPSPFVRDGIAVIVASGPSAMDHVEEIRRREVGDVVFCVNQAHDWLIGNGIIPDYFVGLDPCDGWRKILSPHSGVTYLLASVCHAELFDLCPKGQTQIWHAWSGECVEDELKASKAKYPVMVHGGGTAALRCVHLAYLLGFRKIHMYGVDSSFGKEGEPYAHPSRYANAMGSASIEVECAGRVFKTRRDWAGQANDFGKLFDLFGGSCDIQVFGDGLIPHMAKIMNDSKRRQLA